MLGAMLYKRQIYIYMSTFYYKTSFVHRNYVRYNYTLYTVYTFSFLSSLTLHIALEPPLYGLQWFCSMFTTTPFLTSLATSIVLLKFCLTSPTVPNCETSLTDQLNFFQDWLVKLNESIPSIRSVHGSG